MKKNKIFELEKLSKIVKEKKKGKNKIVLCHGVFDLVHFGHIAHFNKAKELGDILIVTTTADKFINKGPNRPYYNLETRKKYLSNLEMIDYVSHVNSPSAIQAIKQLKPDIYCKGLDYKKLKNDITKKIQKEIAEVKKNKGKIVYTNEITFSSSKILSEEQLILNQHQQNEVLKIKNKFDYEDIKKIFYEIKKLKVLIIGELIIDRYTFCEPLGKSGKDPIMMFKKNASNIYVGGSGAIANNVSQFCKNVKILTIRGKKDKFKRFIDLNLSKNIKKDFLEISNFNTIEKEKILDLNSNNKIVGFYNYNDASNSQSTVKKLKEKLIHNIKKYDLVIVADYGHGLINKEISNLICKASKFLVVNSQINAANIFHHNLNNFKNTTVTIINEGELRHELRDKDNNLNILIKKLSKIIKTKFIVVTRGSKGSILYETNKNRFTKSAAYSPKIVDKIGSGDTLMAVFSIFLKKTEDINLSLFLSSLAASQSVQIVGNSSKIKPDTMLKTIQHLI